MMETTAMRTRIVVAYPPAWTFRSSTPRGCNECGLWKIKEALIDSGSNESPRILAAVGTHSLSVLVGEGLCGTVQHRFPTAGPSPLAVPIQENEVKIGQTKAKSRWTSTIKY